MSDYEQVTDARGVVRYKLDGKFVKASEVPEEVKASLSEAVEPQAPTAPEVQETPAPEPAVQEAVEESAEEVATTSEPEVVDPGASSDDAPIDEDDGIDVEETVKAAVKTDEEGMGFKRVNGKTVDIFDGKTPHTDVRFVANIMVPLSKENYNNKTDGEIITQLKKLKKI